MGQRGGLAARSAWKRAKGKAFAGRCRRAGRRGSGPRALPGGTAGRGRPGGGGRAVMSTVLPLRRRPVTARRRWRSRARSARIASSSPDGPQRLPRPSRGRAGASRQNGLLPAISAAKTSEAHGAVGAEAGQAVGRIVEVDPLDLARQHHGDRDQAEVEEERLAGGKAGQRPRGQGSPVEAPEPGRRGVAQAAGPRISPRSEVVRLVLVGVDRVVAQGPGNPGGVEQQGCEIEPAGHCAKPTSTPQLKVMPRKACGHQVIRFMKG